MRIALSLLSLLLFSCATNELENECGKVLGRQEIVTEHSHQYYLILDNGYMENVDYKTFEKAMIGETRCINK